MISISVASDMSGSFGSQRAECEVTEERICDLFGRVRPNRLEQLRAPARGAAATAPCIAAAPAARAAFRVCVLRVAIVVLLVAIGSAGAAERTGLLAPRALPAKRATSPIAIDGTLDEPAGDGAEPAEHLIQTRPRPGEESPLHTTARVVFDDDALYIGVRLDDPHPELIQAPLGRRDDETTSDWCFVEIDSRHDHRSAFSFGVNAAGMQVDGVFVDDVTYDSSWNAVWQVAATRDAHGWTAEYRIPFSVFAVSRPKPGAPMVWGLNIYRSNPASGESANWSPRVPQLAGVVSLFNDLVIDAAPSPRRIDLAPYGLASTRDGLRCGRDLDVALGSYLAMVATVLPDFGQVDAYPAQLNLTAFELFLPERRPFFTEGLDAFRFDTSLPLVSRGDSFADEAPFYTRRIGRVVGGIATQILGAVKLYGRTDDGWRAGVLAAATCSARSRSALSRPASTTTRSGSSATPTGSAWSRTWAASGSRTRAGSSAGASAAATPASAGASAARAARRRSM